MIPATVSNGLVAYRAAVEAARPIAGLTALQLSVLVQQGLDLVAAIDAALVDSSKALDRPEPSGHPLALIADIETRLTAAQDQSRLTDLRAFTSRAVLNLSRGVA